LEPGLFSQVPSNLTARLESITPLSPDHVWYPLQSASFDDLAHDLRANQPSYFFVAAGPDGKVRSVRQLDPDDPSAQVILPAIRAIAFPVLQADLKPVPSVHLVKVVVNANEKVFVGRSVSPEAIAIASDLAPSEFPLPAPAPTPAPSVTPSGDVYKIGGAITQPRILRKVEPVYAEEARRARLDGMVKLSCVIGADGKARDFKVDQTLGLGLDEKAMEAVGTGQFQPAAKDGQPVNVYATIQVTFHLLDKESNVLKWGLTRAEFHTPPGAARPVLEKIHAPRVARDADSATATLTFDVNEHGEAVNIKTGKSSDEGWARDAASALRDWKFTAAQKDGAPLSVPCTMDFVRGN
jgi:TonB family protein